jgi:hypothetical protein
MAGQQLTAGIAGTTCDHSVPIGKDLAIEVVLPILREATTDK